MRRIINGYRYDTDKATEVATNSGGGESVRDFRYWEETLYRTPRGRWFVAGGGGPMSTWAKAIDDKGSVSGGSGVRPLTGAEARQWLEEAGETDAIEQYFAAEVQDA
jgi:hypothetical protein